MYPFILTFGPIQFCTNCNFLLRSNTSSGDEIKITFSALLHGLYELQSKEDNGCKLSNCVWLPFERYLALCWSKINLPDLTLGN